MLAKRVCLLDSKSTLVGARKSIIIQQPKAAALLFNQSWIIFIFSVFLVLLIKIKTTGYLTLVLSPEESQTQTVWLTTVSFKSTQITMMFLILFKSVLKFCYHHKAFLVECYLFYQ